MSARPGLVPPAIAARAAASRRAPVAFGPGFFALLLLGLLWLLPAARSPQFVGAMLAWDVAAIALWLIDLRGLPAPRDLLVERVFETAAEIGVTTRLRLSVTTAGGRSVRVQAIDDLPAALAPSPPRLLLEVPAGGTASATCAIVPRERGDHRLGVIYLRCQSALRIAERWSTADLAQTVRVYPEVEGPKRAALYLVRSRQVALERRLRHRRGEGREFESLRDYRDGDALRDVCWTATARRGRLVAKSYQVERSQAVLIVLDAGRLLRETIAGRTKMDHAVQAALTLAFVALRSGDRVGLLVYGRRPLLSLPAARGATHLGAILDGLAVVQAAPHEADHARAVEILLARNRQRSLVVWLTDLAETSAVPEVIECVGAMVSRHAVLFVLIGQPDLSRLASLPPEDEEALFRQAAAIEVVERRRLLLAQLRRSGTSLAMELSPQGLATGVVNHYLEIKERGRI
jgi:uncharacterized protein (DUF58 family)